MNQLPRRNRLALQVTILLLSLATYDAAWAGGHLLVLADPAVPIEQAWTHQSFGTATEYRRVVVDGTPYIHAVGRKSASGLYRDVAFSLSEYPWLEWTWRVDKLQQSADIRNKANEDMAATVFLIFGRPSLFNRDVPTLAYVWTNDKLPEGAVVPSPHHGGTTREIVLQGGTKNLGQWMNVRRNVVEDFRAAFGREPPGDIEMIAIWSDNDQTGEPVEAYYGAIRAFKK